MRLGTVKTHMPKEPSDSNAFSQLKRTESGIMERKVKELFSLQQQMKMVSNRNNLFSSRTMEYSVQGDLWNRIVEYEEKLRFQQVDRTKGIIDEPIFDS